MPGDIREAHIYRSELDAMAAHMGEHAHVETGGSLFGLWTHTGAPVVLLATGPGPDARHNPTSFYQDSDWLERAHAELWLEHGLQHVGEWHSHHHIGLAKPSGGDENTVWSAVRPLGWPRFLLGIGNFPDVDERRCTFGLFLFDAGRGVVNGLGARILETESPIRRLSHRRGTWRPRRAPKWEVRDPGMPDAWFSAPHLRRRLARELRGLADLEPACGVRASLRADGDRLWVDLGGACRGQIEIREGFPDLAPVGPAGSAPAPWSADMLVASWIVQGMAAAQAASAPVDLGLRWARRVRVRRERIVEPAVVVGALDDDAMEGSIAAVAELGCQDAGTPEFGACPVGGAS